MGGVAEIETVVVKSEYQGVYHPKNMMMIVRRYRLKLVKQVMGTMLVFVY